MRQRPVSYRASVLHASSSVTCAYSGETIEPGDIAVTIRPRKDHINNTWISLSSISDIIDTLEEMLVDPEEYTVEYHPDTFQLVSGRKRYSCAECDEYNTWDEEVYLVLNARSGDPWIHYECIPDFIDTLEKVSTVLRPSEVVSQRL